eukprot:SAG31_NODE_771_length_12216_cov_5.603862_11_plen_160_part_00
MRLSKVDSRKVFFDPREYDRSSAAARCTLYASTARRADHQSEDQLSLSEPGGRLLVDFSLRRPNFSRRRPCSRRPRAVATPPPRRRRDRDAEPRACLARARGYRCAHCATRRRASSAAHYSRPRMSRRRMSAHHARIRVRHTSGLSSGCLLLLNCATAA